MENWAKKNGAFKMEAKFISNVDPDDAAAVLNSIDVEHSCSRWFPNRYDTGNSDQRILCKGCAGKGRT
ncbi:MAG: hypothetical protein ACLURV_09245 [Gallintestinimicrobium sp.]